MISSAIVTEEDCIRALKEAAVELGETPSKKQYEALGNRPAANSIQRVMGGWSTAKEAAGLRTNPQVASVESA